MTWNANIFTTILFLSFLALFGVVAIIRPLMILRLLMKWPRFIFSRLYRDEGLDPKIQLAFQLLEEDPEAYAETFPVQILSLRASGGIALLILCCSLMILLQ